MRILQEVADEMADILAMRSAGPFQHLGLILEFTSYWRAGGMTADLGTKTNGGIHN